MKNTIMTLFAVAALGAGSVASAVSIPASGTVLIENTVYDGDFTGGEFKATIPGFDPFYTFCLAKNVHIILPGNYNYDLNTETDGGFDSKGNFVPGGDTLSAGAAWLYEKFINGSLYARTLDPSHDTAAGLLQVAIWFLEDEVNQAFVDNNTPGNAFLSAAITHFGSLANAKADDTKKAVLIMNLTDDNGGMYQDVLVYVPDSSTTLALLGLAISILAITRRRVR